MKIKLTHILIAALALAMAPGCATNDQQSRSRRTAQECYVQDGKLLDASGRPMTGCVMMRDGKMMMMDGKLVPMRRNMTMPDGTVCMVDGTCVMKGGATRRLAEGEVLTPGGKLFHAKGLKLPGEY